jgi:hypothetical protein
MPSEKRTDVGRPSNGTHRMIFSDKNGTCTPQLMRMHEIRIKSPCRPLYLFPRSEIVVVTGDNTVSDQAFGWSFLRLFLPPVRTRDTGHIETKKSYLSRGETDSVRRYLVIYPSLSKINSVAHSHRQSTRLRSALVMKWLRIHGLAFCKYTNSLRDHVTPSISLVKLN